MTGSTNSPPSSTLHPEQARRNLTHNRFQAACPPFCLSRDWCSDIPKTRRCTAVVVAASVWGSLSAEVTGNLNGNFFDPCITGLILALGPIVLSRN